MAEQVKIEAGSAYPLEPELMVELRGRNLVTGLPEAVDVSSVELREALRNSVGIIVDTVRQAIDETPPELIADLMEHGIALAGGGALLKGLAQRLTEETKMRVYVADDPLSCVARGRRQGAGKLRRPAEDAWPACSAAARCTDGMQTGIDASSARPASASHAVISGMMSRVSSRTFLFFLLAAVSVVLLILSSSGRLAPVEGASGRAARPFLIASNGVGRQIRQRHHDAHAICARCGRATASCRPWWTR